MAFLQGPTGDQSRTRGLSDLRSCGRAKPDILIEPPKVSQSSWDDPVHSGRTVPLGEEEYPYHDDALVISVRIANTRVKRIMVHTWSLTYVLYFDVFQKLGLSNRNLVLMTTTLIGFTGDSITSLGITMLLVTVDEESRTKTVMVTFMVKKGKSRAKDLSRLPTSHTQKLHLVAIRISVADTATATAANLQIKAPTAKTK
ncbi:hypothetical protein BHM03_00004428 [Ensete ventricosum]|nr:hypothetical protein BHM03_00004428 [Ensete ventricosum]